MMKLEINISYWQIHNRKLNYLLMLVQVWKKHCYCKFNNMEN